MALDRESETLLSPPQEVVAGGNAAVLSYLRRSYAAVIHRQLDLSGFGLKQFPFMALSTPTTLTSLSLNDNDLAQVRKRALHRPQNSSIPPGKKPNHVPRAILRRCPASSAPSPASSCSPSRTVSR